MPTAGALFVVVGYIAQISQDSLLGIGGDSWDTNAYVSDSAGFLLALATTPIQAIMTGLSFDGHFWLLAVASVIAVAAAWLPYCEVHVKALRHRLRGRRKTTIAALIAIVFVLTKFFVFDAPLSIVHDIVLDPPPAPADISSVSYRDLDSLLRLRPDTHIAMQADALRKDIRCSWSESRTTLCQRTREEYRSSVRGEFTAQLWATLLIGFLAAVLLLQHERSRFAALTASVALLYCLTLACAYGKLLKNAEFDFGVLTLDDTLGHDIAQEDDLVQLVPPPYADANTDDKAKQIADLAPKAASTGSALPAASPHRKLRNVQLYALILSRDSSTVQVLVVRKTVCAADTSKASEGITRSTFQASQVLAVEEVYRQDIVNWATANETQCPE